MIEIQSLHHIMRLKDEGGIRVIKPVFLVQRPGSRLMDPEALLAWSQLDDNLLCSIVHEFGSNWRLVADIFALSCTLSGIHRSAAQCLKRFRELAVSPLHKKT